MTFDDMKKLKKDDIVIDLESTSKWGRTVLCEVLSVKVFPSDVEIVITSLKECDKVGYPHRFVWSYGSYKIGNVKIDGTSEYHKGIEARNRVLDR